MKQHFFDHIKSNSIEELEQKCIDLRQFIIDQVSEHGGHFSANLGVVELTVALHYVLNLPSDQLIWDVGHQAYAHKILSGRMDQFHTNRKLGGLSGFPKRSESNYDAFGVGHSSTSISAALGISAANKLLGISNKIVAVIGDGALTAGQAYEALNHWAHIQTPILVVINDNQISIDPTIGLTISKDFIESLGLPYIGIIDGHHLPQLIEHISQWAHDKAPKPLVLHVKTVKGKGYPPAESEQTLWHAPGKFDKLTAQIESSNSLQLPSYAHAFGKTMESLAEIFTEMVAITPAMTSGSGLIGFQKKYPNRFFDTGITEQHAVTFAAGLATTQIKPILAIYSTFLQRGYDQLIHDVALQHLPVILAIDRAGLVGEDGPTHHGVFDIAFLSVIPNIIIAAPSNIIELRNILFSALSWNKPVAIRYPRGQVEMLDWEQNFTDIPLGKANVIEEGNSGIAVWAVGNCLSDVIRANNRLENKVTIIDSRFVRPLDEELMNSIALKCPIWVTIEDGSIRGGFGSLVSQWLTENGKVNECISLGIPDTFIEHGKVSELKKILKIDANGIYQHLANLLGENNESEF